MSHLTETCPHCGTIITVRTDGTPVHEGLRYPQLDFQFCHNKEVKRLKDALSRAMVCIKLGQYSSGFIDELEELL